MCFLIIFLLRCIFVSASKVINLEKELIYIPLNNDEKEVLNIIKNHIKFKDYIEYIDNEIYMK